MPGSTVTSRSSVTRIGFGGPAEALPRVGDQGATRLVLLDQTDTRSGAHLLNGRQKRFATICYDPAVQRLTLDA
jgi:hypothetical protein